MGWQDAPVVGGTSKWQSAPVVGEQSLAGYGKALGSGIAESAAGLTEALPGSMASGPAKMIGWGLDQAGYPETAGLVRNLYPSGSDLVEKFKGVTGIEAPEGSLYEPQNTGERYTKAVGEQIPYGPALGGRALGLVPAAVTGLASEAGGDIAEAGGGNRAVGEVLGGAATGLRSAAFSRSGANKGRAASKVFGDRYSDAVEGLKTKPPIPGAVMQDLFGRTTKAIPGNFAQNMPGVKGMKVPGRLEQALDADMITPEQAPGAYAFVRKMEKDAATGNINAYTLHGWRKKINARMVNSNDPAMRASGEVLRDSIDDFMEQNGLIDPEMHGLWRQKKQLELLEQAESNATRVAERGGQNYTHHLATQLGKLITRDETRAQRGLPPQFDKGMRADMEKIASEKGNKFLDWLGNLSPQSRKGAILNALGIALTGGSSLAYQVPMMAGGYAAKKTAEGLSGSAMTKLKNRIGKQAPPPRDPLRIMQPVIRGATTYDQGG
jgi:hypothetical protein